MAPPGINNVRPTKELDLNVLLLVPPGIIDVQTTKELDLNDLIGQYSRLLKTLSSVICMFTISCDRVAQNVKLMFSDFKGIPL